MTPQITPTQKTPKLAAANRRTHAHLTETASSHHQSTKPQSHVRTTAPLKCTSDLQKMTSRLDTETTPHHSNTQNTETLPNSANIPGPLKKITLTTLFYGTSFHQDHPTTTQAKDATSASKKNYLSSTNLNYHHSINVMNTCPHANTETNNYCVTIEQSIEISRHAFMQVCKLYK